MTLVDLCRLLRRLGLRYVSLPQARLTPRQGLSLYRLLLRLFSSLIFSRETPSLPRVQVSSHRIVRLTRRALHRIFRLSLDRLKARRLWPRRTIRLIDLVKPGARLRIPLM